MATKLRVMSFNIHGGKLEREIEGLSAQADVIRESGADIVLLQEVDVGTVRGNREVDQSRVLAERTGLPHRAFGESMDRSGGQYGNAILSRFPLSEIKNHEVRTTDEPRKHPDGSVHPPQARAILQAVADVDGTRVLVLCTHYPLFQDERLKLSRRLLEITHRFDGPVILGGDLNAHHDDPEIALLREQLAHAQEAGDANRGPGTFPADDPDARLDHLLVRGPLRVDGFRVVETESSDHRPLLAELTLTA